MWLSEGDVKWKDKEENTKTVTFKLCNIVMHCVHTLGFEKPPKIKVWYPLHIFPAIKMHLIDNFTVTAV